MQRSARFLVAFADVARSAFSRAALALAGASLLLLILPGCGGSGVNTVPVTGKVTYQGSPMTHGKVTFSPEDKKLGRPAEGIIDPEGNFSLTTIRADDGALPGEYRVAVLAFVPGTANAVSRGKPAIPEKFFQHATSGLTATVDDRATTVDLDLK